MALNGMAMMAKAFGLNIADEDLRKIETLIPQIPGKVNEIIVGLNTTLLHFDRRISELEAKIDHLTIALEGARKEQNGDNSSRAIAGTTGQ